MTEPHPLITAYLDNALSEAEYEELLAWLKAHPDHLRAFVEANVFEQQVRSAVVGEVRRESAGAFVQDEESRRRNPGRDTAGGLMDRFVWPWRSWAMAGAGVLVAGAMIIWWMGQGAGLRPTIASTQGEVQILRDGQRIPANTGEPIRPGERIRTGPNASAELRLADGTSIRMDGSTDVGFLPGKAARQVQVKTGMVRCDVAKQPPGQPLVFQTPHADLTVLGTAFDLLAAPVESRARVHQGRVHWADGGPGVEVAAGEACTADSQGIQAWQPVCNLDFRTLKAVPPQLETVFCNEESLLTARRRIVPAPNGIRLEDGGLRFATLPHAFGEHGLAVTRWTEPVGGDVAIEVELSAAAKVDGDSTPPADPASERNPNWSLQIAVDGDSFDGYRVVFAAPKYPNGIEVDSIHPVEWMLLARDPRPMPEAGDHTLRVEKRRSQLRVWVDRELRIDTALSYPLAPDRKRTFALSEYGAGPLIRSLRVWRGGRD
ncbi:MAG: hypothetical protein FJ387_14100 [Verrucomicrobia bacterium]|nr:hypothetical protein [Verrucomicrobiota bacterium]